MAYDDPRPLTAPGFWDKFWAKTSLPARPDPAKSYERCYIDLFDAHFNADSTRTVFEAGCAPGMWLAHFHRRFGYQPYGCDTSQRGLALTEENFRLLGVRGNIAGCDLLSYAADKPFDVVLSINFIEHFENPEPILRKSAALLAPGGTLVLSVPNLTGLNAWLSRPEFLAAHNLGVMNKAHMRRLPSLLGLRTVFLDYIGGFEPDLVGPPKGAVLRRACLKALRLARRRHGQLADVQRVSGGNLQVCLLSYNPALPCIS
ncbi:MAG: class I SAM-dependent methyltransferase [Elusimicrobia bacterium]|nr:class I SAM-dependent methyltransferase [Elusimicrobiota bacterium]